MPTRFREEKDDMDSSGGAMMHSRRRRMVLAYLLLPLTIAAMGMFLRLTALNPAIPFVHDEAQYVGVARDFLLHHRFDETTHSRSWYVFLPLGYPAMVVAMVEATGWDLAKAALAVNLGAGVALLLALYFLVLRITGSPLAAAVAQLLAATNTQMVEISVQAMTDSSYALLFVIMAWLLFELLWRGTNGFPWRLAALTTCFAAMFFVRISALPLLALVPAVMLLANWIWPRLPWRRCLRGALVFVLLGLVPVALHAWRLYQYNGFFSISPQLAGNLAQGDLLVFGKTDKYRLDEQGRNFSQRPRLRDSSGLLTQWLKNPADRTSSLINNLRFNLRDTWHYLFNGVDWLRWAGLILLVLSPLPWLWARWRGMPPPGDEAGITSRIKLGLFILSLLWAGHVLAYSLFLFDKRYMSQAFPILIAALATLGCLAMWRGRTLGWGGRRPSLLLGVLGKERLLATGRVAILPLLLAGLVFYSYVPPAWRYAQARQNIRLDRKDVFSIMMPLGRRIQELARRRGTVPRVAATYMGVPYYSQGFGYVVPALEDRPDRLLKYLRHNRINFVAPSQVRGFGKIRLGVPLYYLMDALARGLPGQVTKHEKIFPFFEIFSLPRMGPAHDVTGQVGRGLLIPSGKHYLIWAQYHGPMKRLFQDFLKFRPMFRISREGKNSDLAAPICPGPLRTAKVVLGGLKNRPVLPTKVSLANLYLVLEVPPGPPVRLQSLDSAVRRLGLTLRRVVLYELLPGQQAGWG